MSAESQRYPKKASGKPDLRRYTEPVEHYMAMYDRYLAGEVDPKLAFTSRVQATWGLIAKGAAAIPYAVQMLRHRDGDAREDGAAILAELGKQTQVVDVLLDALEDEVESQARDSMIQALGRMRARKAIPILRETILSERTDGDTRYMAIEALGRIVRRRFLSRPDPLAAATAWLADHPGAAEP